MKLQKHAWLHVAGEDVEAEGNSEHSPGATALIHCDVCSVGTYVGGGSPSNAKIDVWSCLRSYYKLGFGFATHLLVIEWNGSQRKALWGLMDGDIIKKVLDLRLAFVFA